MALEIGSARNKEDLNTVRNKACLNSYIKLSLRFWSEKVSAYASAWGVKI